MLAPRGRGTWAWAPWGNTVLYHAGQRAYKQQLAQSVLDYVRATPPFDTPYSDWGCRSGATRMHSNALCADYGSSTIASRDVADTPDNAGKTCEAPADPDRFACSSQYGKYALDTARMRV